MCGGPDHHQGDYTAEQRADLDLVLAFNRRMSDAINAGLDVAGIEAFLDPDPLRYMWVDEGQGEIARVIAEAGMRLEGVPAAIGERAGVTVTHSINAARPSIATLPDGSRLTAWVEWIPDRGDVVHAHFSTAQRGDTEAEVIPGEVTDVFRPTAAIAVDGTPWVLFGRRMSGAVGVWASHRTADGWSEPTFVSAEPRPSFNQEVVALADGGIEVCWQGAHEDRFGIYARTHRDGTWGPPRLVSEGVEANVWDPSVAAFRDGSTAYAWSEFADGRYRVVVRRCAADGTLGPVRDLTTGSDYALHPHLAVTADQQLWCAFDQITVAGHGGSGPTKLRPTAEVGADPAVVEGMLSAGASVPPELLPDVSAGIRVVAITEDGLVEPSGVLAEGLDVVPSGLPKLAATPDGGLVVAYRIHRKLPLMTYYWEAAAQVLGAHGWAAPITFSGTDGSLEEVSIAATSTGAVIAAQTDARLQVALDWTEGFGGRECPYLHEHHGDVVWHAVHGVGTIVTGDVVSAGAVAALDGGDEVPSGPIDAGGWRADARRWQAGRGDGPRERYAMSAGDRNYQLYWGDLHRHSLVSRCTAGDEPSLEDFYRYAWDVCEYDFWAVTDHSENSSPYQWWSIQKIADLFHIDHRFVPLYGFEWTSADSGHQNVIYGDVERGAPIFSAFADGTTDPAGLWRELAKHPAYPAITIPHHPGSAMVYNDWDYHDPTYSRQVEIFQACRGNYEGLGAFRQYSDATKEGTFAVDGLMRGHKFGFIASSDHGHGASYVGAYAESLDRASVFEALSNRRTFAATTRDVMLDVRLSSSLDGVIRTAVMGEEITSDGPVELVVHGAGYADVARIDIIKNGVVVHSTKPGHEVPPGAVVVDLRVEWGGADGTTCWDGRLDVVGAEIVQTPFWSPEIVSVDRSQVTWENTTYSFGELYGSQRGGIEVTIIGSPQAVVSVEIAGRQQQYLLADLAADFGWGESVDLVGQVTVTGERGAVRLQQGIGGLSSLGAASLDLTWSDPQPRERPTDFYYVRLFQVDGEMAWSSPIWVSSPSVVSG